MTTAVRYSYLEANMALSRAILTQAASDDWGVATIAAKVAVYSVAVFLILAAFEAIVINGVRLLANVGIAIGNSASDYWDSYANART